MRIALAIAVAVLVAGCVTPQERATADAQSRKQAEVEEEDRRIEASPMSPAKRFAWDCLGGCITGRQLCLRQEQSSADIVICAQEKRACDNDCLVQAKALQSNASH